jgi:hypothetical protein
MGKIKVLTATAKKLLAAKKAKKAKKVREAIKIKPGKKLPSDITDLAKNSRPVRKLAPWQQKQLPKATQDRLFKQQQKQTKNKNSRKKK